MEKGDRKFESFGTVECTNPNCRKQNLSWCFACFYCGEDLFDETDTAVQHKQENAA